MHFLSGRHGDNTKGDARGATEWSPDVSKHLALPLVVGSIHVILLHALQGMSVVTSLINSHRILRPFFSLTTVHTESG